MLSGDQLNERLEKIIDMMGKSPFSHLTKLERKKLFKRQHSGQRFAFDSFYSQWTAILGKAQKYVGNAHGTGVDGWEINFKPMDTYGEFEEMIKWFKETLKNAGKSFFKRLDISELFFLSHNLSTYIKSRKSGKEVMATKNQ